MKFLFFFLLLVILSCSNENKYIINGFIKDPFFEGKKVYLVPMDNAVAENVDSTIIKNGKFSFSGNADSNAFMIVRAKSFFPKTVQDLMVILCEGETNVNIDIKSSASGTELNRKLQEWKDKKEELDSLQYIVFQQSKLSKENKSRQDSLKNISDSLSKEMKENNLVYIKNNINNGVGLFIFRIFYHSFTYEEKKEIISLGSANWKKDPVLKKLIEEIK
ncbi:MAG: DUF4369 domain-containing protein [Bacteroidales bacterium]